MSHQDFYIFQVHLIAKSIFLTNVKSYPSIGQNNCQMILLLVPFFIRAKGIPLFAKGISLLAKGGTADI